MRLDDIRVIYNTGVIKARPDNTHNTICRELKNKCILMMIAGMRNIDVAKQMGVSTVTISSWRKEI